MPAVWIHEWSQNVNHIQTSKIPIHPSIANTFVSKLQLHSKYCSTAPYHEHTWAHMFLSNVPPPHIHIHNIYRILFLCNIYNIYIYNLICLYYCRYQFHQRFRIGETESHLGHSTCGSIFSNHGFGCERRRLGFSQREGVRFTFYLGAQDSHSTTGERREK